MAERFTRKKSGEYYRKSITITLPEDMIEQARIMAREDFRTPAQLIEKLLHQEIERRKREEGEGNP
ncbi:MAG: hypothetical protein OXH65_05100 [Paracoccaceae bacterium]|nr:hypothetical protein [Paracoccaceae bacterium]